MIWWGCWPVSYTHLFFRKLSILRIRTYKDIFSYLKLDVDGSFNVVADSIEHIIISQVSEKFMWAFDLNCLKPPNGCCFHEPVVFINVFNPHKTSVLNRLTSTPSSMSFSSNFDFSYTKCHVFESHCRYQRIQSSLNELGWIFLRCFAQVLHYYLLTKRPYAMEDFRWWFLFCLLYTSRCV